MSPRPEGEEGGGNRAELIPPGEYVIALDTFGRKQGKDSGRDYLNGKFLVCSGRHAGKRFFASLSLDFTKSGAVTRWQIYMEAVGVAESFEIGDSEEGTAREGDRNIARLFKGKAFVAEIDVDTQGQYKNNGIKQIVFRRKWTAEQIQWVEEWNDAQAQKADPEDYAGEPPSDNFDQTPPDDDFGPEEYDDAPPARGRAAPPEQDDHDPDEEEPLPPQRGGRPAPAPARQAPPKTRQAPPPPVAPAADDDDWEDKF